MYKYTRTAILFHSLTVSRCLLSRLFVDSTFFICVCMVDDLPFKPYGIAVVQFDYVNLFYLTFSTLWPLSFSVVKCVWNTIRICVETAAMCSYCLPALLLSLLLLLLLFFYSLFEGEILCPQIFFFGCVFKVECINIYSRRTHIEIRF